MIALALAALIGCGGATKALECVDNGECGEGQACVDDKCVAVDCVVSADCSIGSFCSPVYECQAGCESDADCYAGETCDTTAHTCSAYGCRSKDLDCDYGEYCNTESGECFTRGSWCETCNPANLYSCGSGAYCIDAFDDGTGYCYNWCEEERDCPRGFECAEVGSGYENVCFGDCPYMVDNGYLGR